MTLLVAADLLSPNGEIDGALFYPAMLSGDITTRINAYITQGYAKATAAAIDDPAIADKIARIFGYYRAWSDVVNRLTLSPAQSTLEGEGSISMLQSQIEAWIRRRDSLEAQLVALLPEEARTVTTPGTVSIPTRIRF